MNSLSWFIYFTESFDRLRALLILAFGALALLNSIGLIAALISKFDNTSSNETAFYDWWKPFPKISAWIGSLLVFLIVALPSQRTMILIAGSEIGQRIVTSEKTKDIVDPGLNLIKTWIENETLKIKKEVQKDG